MKRFLTLSCLSLVVSGLSVLANADPTPSPSPSTSPVACNILRQANATIIVYKNSWTQQSGIWVSGSAEVARETSLVPVIGESMNGCQLNNLRVDNVLLNGSPETVTVTPWMRIYSSNTPLKRFSASYWVSSDNGRTGWAAADSEDLTTQKLNVNMNTESAAVVATAHQDSLTIAVNFNDNAQ